MHTGFFSLNNSFCCQNRKAIVIHDMLFPKPEYTNEPHPNNTCLRSSLPKRCAQSRHVCSTLSCRSGEYFRQKYPCCWYRNFSPTGLYNGGTAHAHVSYRPAHRHHQPRRRQQRRDSVMYFGETSFFGKRSPRSPQKVTVFRYEKRAHNLIWTREH